MVTALIISILMDPCYIEYVFSVVIVVKHYGKEIVYRYSKLILRTIKTIVEVKIIFLKRNTQTITEKSYAIIIFIVKNLISILYNAQRVFNQFIFLLLDTFNKYNTLLWTLSLEFINITKDFYVGLLGLGNILRRLRI